MVNPSHLPDSNDGKKWYTRLRESLTSRILGTDGQPIQTTELQTPQTAHAAQLHREFQQHPGRGLTPSKLASLLLAAEQGEITAQYELFEDMEERDGHILSEMSKRRRAVSGLSWTITPPPNPSTVEKRNAEALTELLQEIDDIDGIIFDTTDAIGKGFACQEIEWAQVKQRWLPKSITHRPQSWFKLYRGFQQEIRLRDNSADGQPLQAFGWITHIHKARSGYIERANLFRALVWPYLFKNYAVGDLAEFLEIYGIPLRLGKYPPGSSDKEKATLLRALVQIGHNAAGIVPAGMDLTLHKAADGDPQAFELMMDWCERTESKIILGGTLTSQADRGSNTNALGNVHNEIRKELKDSDAKQVSASLSRDLVYPIAALNGWANDGFRRCPRLKLDISESKDISVYASAIPALTGAGMRIKRSWLHEELGIPEADSDDDLLTTAATSPTPVIATATAQPPQAIPTRITADREDQLASLLAQQGDPLIAGMVDQVRELVNNAQSLPALRDGLIDLYPNMDISRLGQLMQQALAVAGVAGQADAQDDSDG